MTQNELDVLIKIAPAIGKIDSGCGTCAGRFLRHVAGLLETNSTEMKEVIRIACEGLDESVSDISDTVDRKE